jgi:energy-coupling factor transporter ATP-binding protein EcfA2
MKIQSLHIQNFTVFEDQKFDFCDGINVFIGANATGKTHVLKAMYGLSQAKRDDTSNAKIPRDSNLLALFNAVFCPAERSTARLIRRSDASATENTAEKEGTEKTAEIKMETDFGLVNAGIDSAGFGWGSSIPDDTPAPLFFPPREMLSAYEGFAASWERRELSFDKTYYDICRHLEPLVLKKEKLTREASDLISYLTDILGGSVIEKGGRFYIKQPDGTLLEAHLLAEGHRKLAMLVRLIANGEIEKDTVLLWDEPESGLNPVLTTKVAQTIRQLAAAGVQVFVATHDYLLTSELSVLAEYKQKPDVPTRFFAFSRPSDDPATPVSVQSGDLLQDLSDNPILKEFVAHYDREERLFAASQRKQGAAR